MEKVFLGSAPSYTTVGKNSLFFMAGSKNPMAPPFLESSLTTSAPWI